MSKWKVADVIFGIVGGICAIGGIVTGIKTMKEDEDAMYNGLEERYGLTPTEKSESED